MSVQLYCGDCLEYMRGMADKSVDAVITDPPHPDGDLSYLLDEFLRIGRRVVLTPGKLQSFNWIRRQAPAWEYCWQVNTLSRGGRACMHIGWEPVLAYSHPVVPLGNDVLVYSIGQSDNGHPWPKPLKFMAKLVRHWSKAGELVFDPFAGSGTTGVACIKEDRNFIGCEIDEGYFKIAQHRIEEAQLQLPLLKVT